MTRTVAEAIAAAQGESKRKTAFGSGECLIHVRSWWGLAAKYPSAAAQWANAAHRHPGNAKDAPAGAPILWTGGSHGFGHIAMAAGDGVHVWTTDLGKTGYTSLQPIALVQEKWGLKLEGWIGDLEGVVLPLAPPTPPAPHPVVVSLANVQAAAIADPKAKQGSALHKSDVLPVEKALAAEGLLHPDMVDGSFGTLTVAAYAAYQRKLGYSGKDANGLPGHTTLVELGRAHGFGVN